MNAKRGKFIKRVMEIKDINKNISSGRSSEMKFRQQINHL